MKQIHVRFSDGVAERLYQIKDIIAAPSITFVLRDAICLYSWALKHIEKGHEIVAINTEEERTKETEFSSPGIDAAKMRAEIPN